MKRGELVTIAVSGDSNKPRPALVVQDDAFSELTTVTVLRLTSELNDWPLFRITVEPTSENGLRKTSQVMIDRGIALPRSKVGPVFGRLSADDMIEVSQALYRFLGLQGMEPWRTRTRRDSSRRPRPMTPATRRPRSRRCGARSRRRENSSTRK